MNDEFNTARWEGEIQLALILIDALGAAKTYNDAFVTCIPDLNSVTARRSQIAVTYVDIIEREAPCHAVRLATPRGSCVLHTR